MKAFSVWRGGEGGSKGSNDAVAELQQVILKKDLMILSLQTQLDAYAAHYGALPTDILNQLEQSDTITENHTRELDIDKKELAAECEVLKSPDTPRIVAMSPASMKSQTSFDADEEVQSCASKNVVLDFVEDSPMFRRQLEGLEESIAGLRALLKELVIHAKEYAAAGKHFGEEETALADELVQRKHACAIFSTSYAELGSLSDLFGEMHDTLGQVQRSRVSMLLGVESLLSRSIQQFSEKELLKEAGELRKEVTKLGDEYETLLAKLLSKPRQPGYSSNGTVTPTGSGDSIGMLGLGTFALLGGSYGEADEHITTGTPPASASSDSIFSPDPGPTINGSDKHQRALEREVMVARRRFELARFSTLR